MTIAFFVALVCAVFGLPYLWRQHRVEVWLLIALYAGQRAGSLVERERQRRQAALAGEPLLD